MIKYGFYNDERKLMITYSDVGKDLHKVGTDEVYTGDKDNAPIDVIEQIIIIDGHEEPRSRFTYEEVDKREPEEI